MAARAKSYSFQKFFGGKKGFSLFELLIVLVIMSIVMVLVGTRIGPSMKNLRLKTATKKIAASLRYARNCAAIQGKEYQILFDRKKNRLLISPQFFRDKEWEDQDNAKIYLFPQGVSIDKVIIDNKEIESEVANIIFYPNGAALGGKVILTGGEKKTYEINIDSITGMVKIISG